MLELRAATPPAWLDVVLADFDAFLIDHAACERKASATGMSFVVRYPDRPKLLEPLIAFAREELAHFHQVYALIAERGLSLGSDQKDTYVRQLRALARSESEAHLLDRLLIAGVVEARGCERFRLVADALDDGPLKEFYLDITRSEARHHGLFVQLARCYFDEPVIRARIGEILDREAAIMQALPLRPAVH
jgi:tRNA 2-(methylsulfanyl)-N6-isopentenyladenosine37 hydroxylase